jgi:hypothetical protein
VRDLHLHGGQVGGRYGAVVGFRVMKSVSSFYGTGDRVEVLEACIVAYGIGGE